MLNTALMLKIVGFAILATGVAFTLHQFVTNDNARILAFVFFVLLLAILFPYLCEPLNKEAVDLAYYSAGMLAAAVLFLTHEIERQHLTISERVDELQKQQRRLDTEQRHFDFVAQNGVTIIKAINALINYDLSILVAKHKDGTCSSEYLANLIRSEDQGDPSLWLLLCMREAEMLQKAGPNRALATRSLAETKRLVDLLKLDEPLQVGDRILPKKALELLEHARRDEQSWREDMRGEKSEIERRLTDRQSALAEMNIKGQSALNWTHRFIQFYWPYILIAFLGLKIARFDYLARPAKETEESR